MDEKIFSDLDHKIVKLFSKKDLELLELVKCNRPDPDDLFLSISKVSMLIFGKPNFRHLPRIDINAPVVDGLFPLHLAVMTSSTELVVELLISYGAKLDVKCCGDPNSPFHALTPLELAFQILRNLTPWTPHQSLHDLLCMLHANTKVKLLIPNISRLLSVTPGIRHLISNYSLQGKVVELAVSLTTPLSHGINFSTMYISTANVPPELHFGVNGILRMLVASRSASLIKEAIHLSGSLNNEEYDNCTRKIKEMDCVRTLLELAERGDLNNFDVKQQLNVQLTDGSTEGSQEHNLTADESKVNTVAPQYLKNCLLYVEPSKFQPCGAFNSLMPRGYKDSLMYYDGLDIRKSNDLAETFFRVLDGRKVEEFSLVDTRRFRLNLEYCLQDKVKEAETLKALENKQAEEKKRSTLISSLPRSRATLIEAFKHLDVKNISSSVFSAIRKGKA